MQRRTTGTVAAITSERPGAQEITARIVVETGETETRSALNFVALTGRLAVGERVLLNTVAVEMRLGTGGADFVVARPDAPPEEEPAPGHILKLRYTPLQMPVLAVEAPESPHHESIRRFDSLAELPIVCAELHSQLPAICAAAKWALAQSGYGRPPRIVFIMTEGAALPLALSRLVPAMRDAGLLDATITAGQAFGGDYEAVNLYSALAAAKDVAGADIIIVAQGPGNVGTNTPLGFSGVEQGLAINAAASLGGVAVAVPRISFADARDRHRGLSHHTITVLTRIALAPALVPIPRLPAMQQAILQLTLDAANIADTHDPIIIQAEAGLAALDAYALNVTTMGRSVDEERPFFLAAAAAGLLAAQLVEARSAL